MAQPGDWVIGFLPKRIDREQVRVAWVGQVAEVIKLGDYQDRLSQRPDAIYRRTGYSLEGREILEPLRTDYHHDEASRTRDRRGENALLFERFWYWGAAAVAAPNTVADMVHYFVGQASKGSTPERVVALEQWLNRMGPSGAHGKPRDPLRTTSPCSGRRASA
jgi:hypothetical protein